jgi:hypothetical protein
MCICIFAHTHIYIHTFKSLLLWHGARLHRPMCVCVYVCVCVCVSVYITERTHTNQYQHRQTRVHSPPPPPSFTHTLAIVRGRTNSIYLSVGPNLIPQGHCCLHPPAPPCPPPLPRCPIFQACCAARNLPRTCWRNVVTKPKESGFRV